MMKKVRNLLVVFIFLLILTACSQQTQESEREQEKIEIETHVAITKEENLNIPEEFIFISGGTVEMGSKEEEP